MLKKNKGEFMGKSKEYITWDQYFMGVAKLSALRSKDPNTKVGACIVNEKKRIVGIGYNGLPYGCSDDEFPWEREGEFLETKYPYVVHAEQNAVIQAAYFGASVKDASIYITNFPCVLCAKILINAGIKEVVYLDDYVDTLSREILEESNVIVRRYVENK